MGDFDSSSAAAAITKSTDAGSRTRRSSPSFSSRSTQLFESSYAMNHKFCPILLPKQDPLPLRLTLKN